MFNTYIYGTPLGFDFFEDIVSLKEYFKGFYISTRKGRRLMVNRRDNGETFYNYLRYGLAEKEGRPNSFFGMSISIDNDEYAYDFKEIFDWFDYLFEKLVERGFLFFVNAGNIIQYKVSKFKDATEEMQWLKNNIPNLFTKTQGIKLLEFDSTFSSSSSGQIRCFNDNTSNAVVIEAFKKSRWIALSPNFKPEEEPIEIDLYDIDAQINRYNQQLVPIAISPKQENLGILRSIENNCSDIIHLVQKYLSTEHDGNEQKECKQLIARTHDIVYNTRTIISKIKNIEIQGEGGENQASYQICRKCGRNLPMSNYDNQNSLYCHDCTLEDHDHKRKIKKCVKCGLEKPLSEFPKKSLICFDCNKSKSILDYLDSKVLAIAFIAILIIGVSAYLIIGGEKSDNSVKDVEESSEAIVSEHETDNNQVDVNLFNSYIGNAKFLNAYDIIKGKEGEDKYLAHLSSSIQSFLWNLIDQPGNTSAVDEIKQFFIINNRLVIDVLHLNENDWIDCAQAYSRLMTLVQKTSLSQAQRNEARQLIEKLPMSPERIRQTFKDRIESMPKDEELYADNKATPKVDKTNQTNEESPYIELISNNGTAKFTGKSGKEFSDGTKITVKSNVKLKFDGPGSNHVKPNRNRTQIVIDVKAETKLVITAGTSQLTITGKPKFKTI